MNSSDSEDSDEEKILTSFKAKFQNYKNNENEENDFLVEPKIIEDSPEKIYHSGFGNNIDIEDSANKLFSKSEGDSIIKLETETENNLYEKVNDWNVYGQGSWKDFINEENIEDKKEDDNYRKTVSEESPRHPLDKGDNKKFGLFYTLTKRFKVRPPIKRVRPGKKNRN